MGTMTITDLAEKIDDFIEKRDWGKYHRPKDIAIALSVESSELLEIFQWKDAERRLSEKELNAVEMETADIVIYAISMANACGFDLGRAVMQKILINEEKYPIKKSKDMFD